MATTVSQPVPSAQAHTLADLGFEDADTLRWQYVCKEVAQRLTSLPHGRFSYMTLERVRQALDLAQRGCVSLSEDPNDLSAEVRSGSAHYQVHMGAGTCQCSDYQKRKTTCKHQLAVDIHLGALAQFDPSAPTQEAAADTAPGEGPVAEQPTPSAAPPPNPEPPAAAVASAAHLRSAEQWPTCEAPASMNVKLRVGNNFEIMYTARDTNDRDLQDRMTRLLPWLAEVMAACEANYEARQKAARQAEAQAKATPPPAPERPLQEEIAKAVQAAMQAQMKASANGHRSTEADRLALAHENGPSWCAKHETTMKWRDGNARGPGWFSHQLSDGSYCKGK